MTRSATDKAFSRKAALVDIFLVIAISALAWASELALADRLPWGEEGRGVIAVLTGSGSAVWLTLHRGRSLSALGFRKPARWWTLPFWAVGIMTVFVLAQGAAATLLGGLFDFPEPDFSRYGYVRGNLAAALSLGLVLPLTAAVPEEVLYRGFLIERLTCLTGNGRGGRVAAVLSQAVIFGSIHFQWGIGGVLFAAVMGAVWGFAFLLCGRNLWIVILAHSTAHVALVAQLYSS